MKKLLNILLYIVIVIWTLPQTLIGLFVMLFCKITYKHTEVKKYKDIFPVHVYNKILNYEVEIKETP